MTTTDLRSTTGKLANQRQVVTVTGPDAVDYLQGQLSQDVAAMAPGDTRWSLVLQPQGKISAWFRVTRTDHEAFVLDVDAGWADEVLTRLNRFKLRTDAEIVIAPWESVTIVGPQAEAVEVAGHELDLLASWAGVPVRDVFGADLAGLDDLPEVDEADLTALRIEAGVPRMGSELDESTIPAAAGIVDKSVSFSKGCYTGQELVARVDSRGNNVPKRLLSLVVEGSVLPEPGSSVVADGAEVGTVTSAAWSSRLEAVIALAYIRRGTEVGAQISVGGEEPVEGTVHDLPLVAG